ncbi:MAG: acylphosphatase [Verrucomicrobiales bacterium]
MTARLVRYEGHVQGVGFRYTVKSIARGFEVSGTVRNLPDGRVELVAASADPEELEAFLHDIAVDSPLAHHIKRVETQQIPAPGGLRGFEIIS